MKLKILKMDLLLLVNKKQKNIVPKLSNRIIHNKGKP